jgi:hypothetical protein
MLKSSSFAFKLPLRITIGAGGAWSKARESS